ncbi:MAG TPA: glycosyltransferase [Pseudomonadales bacterium]|nr:glycosyltransferase [Pseudomonadales bacterium]
MAGNSLFPERASIYLSDIRLIPRTLHFCYFGLDTPWQDFSLVYYLAIKSAIEFIQPEKVFFYNTVEPQGRYWEAIAPRVERIQCEPPREIYGRPLYHYAHQADVVRLQRLYQAGGIYLDMDTICLRPFDSLLKHPCVLGIQDYPYPKKGLCNAVILCEPHSAFIEEWLKSYDRFRSTNKHHYWDEHSVLVPWDLAKMTGDNQSGRSDLHVEPVESFFRPGWWPGEQERLFARNEPFPQAYCYHLSRSQSQDLYLKKITEEYIREVDTTYNVAARKFLPNLS